MTVNGAESQPHRRSTFPPGARLRKRHEFQDLLSSRRKSYTGHFMVVLLPRLQVKSAQLTRIGITVTKKIEARATRRNWIKRRVREWFRQHRADLIVGVDIGVIARLGAGTIKTDQIWAELQKAASELRLYRAR